MFVLYHSKTATALKQAGDEIKETLDDTARAQSAANETMKDVENDMIGTRQQINAVSVYAI